MGLARVFGLCFAFLFASSLSAANIIDLGPSDYKNWGSGSFQHRPQGINAKFGQTVRMPPMNTNLTVTRNPVVPYGSIANAAKTFTRINPASVAASAAITALFLGLDWVFDEELDSWAKESFDELTDPDLHIWGMTFQGERLEGPTPDAVCDLLTIAGNNQQSPFTATVFTPTWARCQNSGGTYYDIGRIAECPEGAVLDGATGICVLEGQYIPVTDSDFQELESYLPSADAGTVGSAAGDLQGRQGAPLPGYTDLEMEGPGSTTGPESTTTTTTESGDTIVTSTTTTTNYNYGDTTITTTNTTTSTTYTNGSLTSTETTTESPGELPVDGGGGAPPAGEWPGFCDWATVVCEWLDWTQEEPPPDVDLPQVIDDDFYNEKTISFGAKSCPPDYEINLTPFLETTVGVSFQPLCDFAGLIYYMVMAASYIFAAYISIGVARNG